MINFNYCWLRADPWPCGWVLLRRVKELSELEKSQTSCCLKGVLGKRCVCRRFFSHHSQSLSGGVAAAYGVWVSAESTWNWEWGMAGGEDDWWLLLLLYSLPHLCSSKLRQADRMTTPILKDCFCYSFKAHSFCLFLQWCSRLCQWLQ